MRTVDLRYSVQTSPTWRTQRAHVQGVGRTGPVTLEILHPQDGPWSLNGVVYRDLETCQDLDLSFTPATNLLSLRRLDLKLGESAEVTAAWLQYPDPGLTALRQRYHRLPNGRYAYQCPDLPFEAILEVTPEGFVGSYPPLWEPEDPKAG